MMPKTDEGYLIINAEMDTGVRLELMSERTRRLEQIILKEVPELKALICSIGGSWWQGVATHQATLNVRLGTREERAAAGQRSTAQVAADLRRRFANTPGMTIRINEGSSFMGRGSGSGAEPVAVEIRGYDLDMGGELARQVKAILQSIPGIVDSRITLEGGVPEALLKIDRQKAADLRLWVEDIAAFLEICMAGKEAAKYRELGKEYPINVRLRDSEKLTLDEMLNLSVTNADGNQVSLNNVLAIEDDTGPTIIERKNQQRVTTIKAALEDRALGSAMEEVMDEVRSISLPSGFSLEFGDDYEDQQEMMVDLVGGFALALILVYMVMACQFESLRDPFIVMFSVPLAAIGVSAFSSPPIRL